MAIKLHIGVVISIDSDYLVRFKIPSIAENMSKFPPAQPLTKKVQQILTDDQVFIIQPNDMIDEYFYLPIEHDDYVGLWYGNAIVNVTGGSEVVAKVSSKTTLDDILSDTDSPAITISDSNIVASIKDTKLTITETGVIVHSANITFEGGGSGIVKTSGSVSPTGSGPYCAVTVCPFSGLPHVGNQVTGA
jgi:hypothetical protein